MKKINKVIICIISIFLIIAGSNIVNAESEKNQFSGNRNVIIQIDESDMNSYISGGREGFEYAIRKNKPIWLNYTMKTANRTITIAIDFDFSTYEEYVERLEQLLEYQPTIIYEEGKKVNLAEGFKAIELTNFIKNGLEAENMLVEGNIQDFFTVTNSTLKIQENEYETKEAIDTRENQDIIQFSRIYMETTINNISSYTRKITATVGSDEKNFKETAKERFQSVGELEKTSNSQIIVTFEAKSLEELAAKTMKALNVSVLISEKVEYHTEERVKVTYEEIIDSEKLITPTGAIYQTINCPETFEKIESEEESAVNIRENKVILNDKKENMVFTYLSPIAFKNIKVITDFSNMFGEIERKIVLQIPVENAIYYQEGLKEKISSKLTKGMILNIYDEDAMRCYSIEFKALTIDRIEEKTSDIILGKNELEFNNKHIFFLESSIKEKLEVNTIIEGTLQPEQIQLEYILPESTNKIQDNEVEENIFYITNTSGNPQIEITFTYNNYVLIGLILLGIIIIIIIILIIVNKIKKKIKKRKENKEQADTKIEDKKVNEDTSKVEEESKKEEEK